MNELTKVMKELYKSRLNEESMDEVYSQELKDKARKIKAKGGPNVDDPEYPEKSRKQDMKDKVISDIVLDRYEHGSRQKEREAYEPVRAGKIGGKEFTERLKRYKFTKPRYVRANESLIDYAEYVRSLSEEDFASHLINLYESQMNEEGLMSPEEVSDWVFDWCMNNFDKFIPQKWLKYMEDRWEVAYEDWSKDDVAPYCEKDGDNYILYVNMEPYNLGSSVSQDDLEKLITNKKFLTSAGKFITNNEDESDWKDYIKADLEDGMMDVEDLEEYGLTLKDIGLKSVKKKVKEYKRNVYDVEGDIESAIGELTKNYQAGDIIKVGSGGGEFIPDETAFRGLFRYEDKHIPSDKEIKDFVNYLQKGLNKIEIPDAENMQCKFDGKDKVFTERFAVKVNFDYTGEG